MPPVLITRWASQKGRRLPALEPDYARIDDRSFPDLLARASRMSRQVRYFDADDQADGDWSALFLADSAILLAVIATADTTGPAERIQALGSLPEEGGMDGFARLCEAFSITMGMVWEVNAWLDAAERLPPSPAGAALLDKLTTMVRTELAPLLRRLCEYGLGAGLALGEEIIPERSGLHFAWAITEPVADSSIYSGAGLDDALTSAVSAIADVFTRISFGVAEVAAAARAALDADLARPDHPPHTALYMAFVQLFRVGQAELNQLPDRLVEYYYREILKEPLREAAPDRVYLTVTAAPTPEGRAVRVPAGARFPAGMDASGRAVTFTTDHDLIAADARLARLRTIRVMRGSGLVERGLDKGSLATALLSQEIEPAGLAPGFAAFGAGATLTSPDLQPASLGFLVADPDLALSTGARRVSVTFLFGKALRSGDLSALLQRIGAATGLTAEAAMGGVLAAAFEYAFTSRSGWKPVAPKADPSASPDRAVLTFELSPADPAIGPLIDAATPTAPFQGHVGLRALLNQASVSLAGPKGTIAVWPLALLDGFDLAGIDIRSEVRGLTGMRIETPEGPVDGSAPFAPFGAPARCGAALTVHHPELDGRKIDTIQLVFNWSALPQAPLGFAGYYSQYVIGPDRLPTGRLFDNQSFRVVVRSGAGALPETFLFATDRVDVPLPADGAVAGTRRFILDRAVGPVTVTLTAPAYAFGDDLYPINLLNAVQPNPVFAETGLFGATLEEEVRRPPTPWRRFWTAIWRFLRGLTGRKAAEGDRDAGNPLLVPDVTQTYPNPPWRLEAASVSLDYAASFRVTADASRGSGFHHLAAFGDWTQADMQGEAFRLLPRLGADGVLDLGFSGLRTPAPLTLLAQTGSVPGQGLASTDLDWQGWDGVRWTSLPAHAIAADETRGLTATGLLSLALPRLGTGADGLAWVRAACTDALDARPLLTGLTLNAVSASRQIDAASVALDPTPAMTIKAAAPSLPGLAAVVQPLPSFGGRPAEQPSDMAVRMSERLKHKGRAVAPCDYEKLVLDRFPEIDRVRTLPTRGGGRVSLAVVPRRDVTVDADAPRASAQLKARVASLISDLASPFARVEVIDPVYVRIKVQASVSWATAAPSDAGARVNKALRDFLSPWSDSPLPEGAAARRIHAHVLDFIQSLPEVAAVGALELAYDPDPEGLGYWTPASAAGHEITDADGSAPTIARPTP